MVEVKWIKLSTELFNNRKIRQIECLPEGNALIVMWVRLLCLAGNINDSGQIYFTKEIPYTDQMLATQFNMPLTTVQLALKIFEQFGMIEVIDEILHISNWEKYQSVDKLSELREYNRLAKQKSRAKKKLLQSNVLDVSKTSQPCHDTDIDKDKEEEKEEDKENIIFVSDETKKPSKKDKPVKHKYGEYKNVLLTDDELEKLKTEYSDYEERIERLSGYIASTGKAYKSHYATIRNWARKDAEKGYSKQPIQQPAPVQADYQEDFWADQK